MNVFGHDHDHYDKNDMTKICQIIDLEGIFSLTEKWKHARTYKSNYDNKTSTYVEQYAMSPK